MSYKKNTSGQKFNVLAVNTATSSPVTGDAANITDISDLVPVEWIRKPI